MSIKKFTPAELEAFERVMRNALRNDFYAFVEKAFQAVSPGEPFLPNWHLDAICHALKRVEAGEIKRLIILMPPRNLKSICAPERSSASATTPSSRPSTPAIAGP